MGFDDDLLGAATKINQLGKVLFLALIFVFNLVFWLVALNEYVKDAQHYLHLDEVA